MFCAQALAPLEVDGVRSACVRPETLARRLKGDASLYVERKTRLLGFQDVRKKTRFTFKATEMPRIRFLPPWPALREDTSPRAGGMGSVLLSVPRQ